MLRKIFVYFVSFQIFCVALFMGQQNSPFASAAEAPEFPVTLQQNIVAGKTTVGTKIQANLAIATLLNGQVIPRNAIFSGEVIESEAKTSSKPSRLSLRMDTVRWKSGSAPVKIYLTAWYYPTVEQNGQDLRYGPTKPANQTWNGAGQYPDPNSKIYRPFPGDDSSQNSSPSNTPVLVTSNHRIQMKEVESLDSDDGTITLLNNHRNLKLDKLTTYVLSARDVAPPRAK